MIVPERRSRYVAAYTERFGRSPRATPEFAEPRPCRVPSSSARPRTTPAVDR